MHHATGVLRVETAVLLAVDDDADILYMLRAIGETAGWTVLTAQDAESAMSILASRAVDLILLDYHMPGTDGLTLLRRIREDRPHLPVLVLTVDERQEVADTFLAEGATDFALKPVRVPDLVARIRLHLRLAASTAVTQGWDEGELPKGIHPATLAELVAVLKRSPTYRTLRELADEVGFAYQTVWRYVNFLEEHGAVTVRSDYGSIGRPTKMVAWKR